MDKKRFDGLVEELKNGRNSCLIVKGEDILRFSLPGVKALLTLLKEDPGLLKDSFVFDKIIGKGAAALLILGEVKEIYAELISDHAISLLENTNIKFSFGKRVPFIENKTRNGFCPIELLSLPSNDPKVIYDRILEFLSTKNSFMTI